MLRLSNLKPKHALSYVITVYTGGVESEYGRTEVHLGLGQHKSKILADSLFHVWALISGKHIHLFISWFIGERP